MSLLRIVAWVFLASFCGTLGHAQAKRTPPPTVKPRAPERETRRGVRALFSEAQKLLQQGKNLEALSAFEQILKIYPGHQPSLIQMGKILYRLDRIPEAHSMFTRINPIGLDLETSYEYAMTHFWMRKYEQALYGFRRVPEGHALSDLSNYYGAISALKLRRLVEAETMMEKAVVLPQKLAQSRTNYLKHIQELKLLYEKQGLTEERERERKRIEESLKKSEPVKGSSPTQPDKKAGYTHSGFQEIEVVPELGVNYKQQLVDKHGYAVEKATVRITYFQFKGGPLVPLPLKFGKDQAAFGLQLLVRAEEEVREGTEKRNVQSDDVEDIQRIQTSEDTKSLKKFGVYSVAPWLEFPTPAKIWISLGGKLAQKFEDFEARDRSGTRSGFLQLASRINTHELTGKYSYAEVTDKENDKLTAINSGYLSWYAPPTDFIDVFLEFTHNFYTYEEVTMDGPTSATSLEGDTMLKLPLGINLGLKIAGQYVTEYLYHDVPTYGDIVADGQTFTGTAYLLLVPIKWLSVEVSEEIQKTTWSIEPEDARDTFEQNYPDYQETLSVKASLNLLF